MCTHSHSHTHTHTHTNTKTPENIRSRNPGSPRMQQHQQNPTPLRPRKRIPPYPWAPRKEIVFWTKIFSVLQIWKQVSFKWSGHPHVHVLLPFYFFVPFFPLLRVFAPKLFSSSAPWVFFLFRGVFLGIFSSFPCFLSLGAVFLMNFFENILKIFSDFS